ncbi:hypothetical protein COB57_02935 [Candidatus Peregrinibacteria bacterium]|nr:MAG: hypothetical protein COB57_02935 [Candidatus Peregrinibacteria bacterium]
MRDHALIFISRLPTDHMSGKTRIKKDVTHPSAVNDFTKNLCLDMLNEYQTSSQYDIIFSYHGELDDFPIQKKWNNILFTPQEDGSLGEKMKYMVDTYLTQYKKIILVGSDIPNITHQTIQEGFQQLEHHDIIIAPAEDQGYGCIGFSKNIDVFSDIQSWDSGAPEYDLMTETLTLIQKTQASCFLFPLVYDIDYKQDVVRLWNEIQNNNVLHTKYIYLKQTFQSLRENISAFQDQKDVSIIIPCYNEENTIINTLKHIQEDPNVTHEIIIVDGGSTDTTVDVIQEFIKLYPNGYIRLFSSPLPGRAAQMNHGAKFAQGNILAFLHADTLLPESAIQTIYTNITDKCIAGCFSLKFQESHTLLPLISRHSNRRAKTGMMYGDQCICIQKEVFMDMGGYKDIKIMEDVDLSYRLKKIGKTIVFPSFLTTSARRLLQHGVIKTSMVYKLLRILFFFNASQKTLLSVYKKILR